jgi:hypothetical protein
MNQEAPSQTPDVLSRKYLGVLAVAALLILVIGIAIRPRDSVEATAPSESVFQQLSQESAIRAEDAFFARRIEALSDQVLYLPGRGSALRWSSDTIIVTSREQPVLALPYASDRDSIVVASAAEVSLHTQRLLLVARRPDGELISFVTLQAGRVPVSCAENTYEAFVLSTPLSTVLAGAGLFDLNGGRVGIVAYCGAALTALPVREADRARREALSPAVQLGRQYGIMVAPVDDNARRILGADSGLVVVEVESSGAAAAWGLAPADVLLSVNAQAVRTPAALLTALSAAAGELRFLLRRNGRDIGISALPTRSGQQIPASTFTVATSSGGVTVTALAPSHRLYRAGLRTGDEITQLGTQTQPNDVTVRRLLADSTSSALLVAYRRGTVRGVIFVPPGL